MRLRTRSLIPAALLLYGCSLRRHEAVAPAPARGPARDSLFAFDRSRSDTAAARGAASAVLGMLAPAAAYLHTGAPPVFTRDAVAAILSNVRADAGGPRAWEPLGGDVSVDLNSAYTYGIAARAVAGKQALGLGRYVAYWQRSRGRPWRMAAYVETGEPASPNADAGISAAQIAPPPPLASRTLDPVRRALRVADSTFSDLSYRLGTAFAFSNTIAPDGVVFGSPELLIGPKAVRESFDAQSDPASLAWTPVYADAAGSRDIGFTVGEYISTGRGPSGAAVQRFGKYLTVWKRQPDGTWKFVVDAGNSSPPRAAADK